MPDEIDQITEQAQVEADLARLKQGKAEAQQPLPPEGSDILPAPTEGREITVEVRPERPEEKPAEPVVVKPEEQRKPPVISEKEQQYASRMRKENEKLTRELNDLRRLVEQQTKPAAKPEDANKPPTFEDDPALYLKNENETLKQELNALKTNQQQNAALTAIQQQEQTFVRDHPDYWDARKYMDTVEERQWEKSGLAVAHVNEIQQAVRLAQSGDLRFKVVADKLAEVSGREDVVSKAEEQGRSAEDIAAWLIARDTYLGQRHQAVWQGAQATGRNAAEIAYELATDAGYKRAATEAGPVTNETEREKVLQAARVAEASNSLSETNAGEATAGPKIIRNRNDVMRLNDDELDAIIANGSYKTLFPQQG